MTFIKAQYPRLILVMLCLFAAVHLSFNVSLKSEKHYSKEELLGKIDPTTHPDFAEIPSKYCLRSGLYLRHEVLDAFLELHKNAQDEDIEIVVISATRPYNHQKSIWDRKWGHSKYMGWQDLEKVKDILKYSSMPGTSRHHWGTDLDLNALENSYFETDAGLKVYDFLERCGGELGFVQVYTDKSSGRTGYEEEKWHWSYMPVSSVMLEDYNEFITSEDITGFEGSDMSDSIQIINHFVNGIAK